MEVLHIIGRGYVFDSEDKGSAVESTDTWYIQGDNDGSRSAEFSTCPRHQVAHPCVARKAEGLLTHTLRRSPPDIA